MPTKTTEILPFEVHYSLNGSKFSLYSSFRTRKEAEECVLDLQNDPVLRIDCYIVEPINASVMALDLGTLLTGLHS